LLIGIAGLTGGAARVGVDSDEETDPRQGALQGPAHACQDQDLNCPELVEFGLPIRSREPDSYLFLDGVVYPYVEVTDDLLGDSRVLLPDGSTITVRRLLRAFGLEAEAFDRLRVECVAHPADQQVRRRRLSRNPRHPDDEGDDQGL
jgi:hypothetical protein